MNKSILLTSTLIVSVILAGTGCDTTSQGSKTYTRDQAMAAQKIELGSITAISDVTIEKQESGVGAAAGGVAGGFAGSTVGHGRGSTLAATAAAAAGAAVGSAVERKIGKKPAYEIQVKTDDGRQLVIVQEKDEAFITGERVRILTGPDGRMRVRH